MRPAGEVVLGLEQVGAGHAARVGGMAANLPIPPGRRCSSPHGAAVVEVGSYLSHAGTVAREFGMPCVVDVAGATGLIRNGERVAVDGDRGIVRRLAAAEEVA